MNERSRAVGSTVIAAVFGAVVALWACGFFEAWDGRVVSHRPRAGEADQIQVLIATDRGAFETWWPAEVVLPLDLAVNPDPASSPPPTAGSAAGATHKDRYTLRFTVGGAEASTASTGSVSLGVLAGALALALRNMVVAGAPWRFTPSPAPARPPTPGPPRPNRTGFTRPPQHARAHRRRRR